MDLIRKSSADFIELPPQQGSPRKTLFLDLDETLVQVLPTEHVHNLKIPQSAYEGAFSFVLDGRGRTRRRTVFRRQCLDKFLEFASETFEVVLYTAAKQSYAERIVAVLGEGKFAHRLFRQHCFTNALGEKVKKLNRVHGRKIEECVLVDDNETHVTKNSGNCIPIRAMDVLDPTHDMELRYLEMLLMHVNTMENVQPFLETLLGQ